YTAALLVGLWHVDAVLRDARLEIAVSSLLLPWLHYMFVPALLLEALVLWRRRTSWWIAAPVILSVLPLLPFILSPSPRREAASSSIVHTLLVEVTAGEWEIVPWIAIVALTIRPIDPARRLFLGGFAAMLITIGGAASVALVRPSAGVLLLPWL